MIQTLINASIIWALSLAVYQLLLRRLTFHRLNRYYLVTTLITGIILPLLWWGQSVQVNVINSASPIFEAGNAKEGSMTLAQQLQLVSSPDFYNINWIVIIYLSGAGISLSLLLRDLLRILRLYRNARISNESQWVIAETGGAHGPFSFFKVIFAGSRDSYTEQQWQIIMDHERQHYENKHFLDLILIQACTIPFWFHPLVYIYKYNFRLLHEYEADSKYNGDVASYGKFLIEQAVIGPSPALTHPFSFSPLKNRISMMTKKVSGPEKRWRFLLSIPLMSCFIWCCSQNRERVSIDIKDRYAMRHSAQMGYTEQGDDEFEIESAAGKITITMDAQPAKLNNEIIVRHKDLKTAPKCVNPGGEFGLKYLIEHSGAEEILKKMVDGEYHMILSDVIVNKTGTIDYYMLTFPENRKETTKDASGFYILKPNGLTTEDKNAIQEKIATVAMGRSVEFTAALSKYDKPVPTFLKWEDKEWHSKFETVLQVKNHSITYLN